MEQKKMTSTNQTAASVRSQRGLACLAGFLSAMMAWPSAAGIEIPSDPLTTGARVAPNILFILDDSGSMAFDYMPDNAPTGFRRQSYASNTLYYDPSKTYEPWIGADGNRLTGGTSFDAVYGSFNLVGGGTIDLGSSSSCRRYNYNTNATSDELSSGGTQVCGGLARTTFYVPKSAADAGSSSESDYYRFQIHSDGAIIRSERGSRSGSGPNYNEGLSGRGCSTATGTQWRNCTRILPESSNRTEEQERANFATWFSYHRTRMKAAKAGASEAFATLDGQVRVGFRTIHDRNGFDIPVGDGNDGRFVDNEDDPGTPGDEATTSRSVWYDMLRAPIGYSGTPLLSALTNAGEYYTRSDASGPYGPESGANQLSCRQNFSILTTDGYWNSESVNIGNVDDTDGDTITGPNNQSYTYTAGAPFRDSYWNTLADVAMHYWKRDLRTEDYMINNVPTRAGENPAFWQHMVTFGISIGFSTSRGWSSVADVPDDPSWPDPQVSDTSGSASIPARIDDLLHAAVNGRGEFVAASDPEQFANGLAVALAAIAERTSSASNVAANTVSLGTDAKLFNASYVSGSWTGALTAREVGNDGVGDVAWSASIPTWNTRRIFTSNGTSGASFPTEAQITSLTRGGGPANYEVTGENNANYLKGEQRLEDNRDGTLRVRTGLLGDIINSSPAYVADTETIYVGANDGMLHAFDATNGNEVFAFVPGILDFNTLAGLSRGDYTHRYFVDGPVVVGSRNLTPNKNILVGTLGRGGKGLYALNVSSPSSFGASDFMWELGETEGGNMGLVLGKPILSKVAGQTNPVAVVGNGVNSANDQAVLVLVDAETGNVIREINTNSGSAAQPNGLFAPVGIYGADGRTLAYVYAGDMLGNVWKFDLTNAESASWSVQRIFTAQDSDGNRQPITAGLAVATHPFTHDRWVFFGTGRFLTNEDASVENMAVQSMYGFIDGGTAVSRDELTRRTVEVTGDSVRGFEANTPLDAGDKGWYVDLPERGERIIQDAQIVSTFMITASIIPSGSACDADGTGYINALDAFTGTSARSSYFDRDGDGSTADDVIEGRPIGSVNLGVGMPTMPTLLRGLLVAGGSGTGGVAPMHTLPARWDRASWREIRGD